MYQIREDRRNVRLIFWKNEQINELTDMSRNVVNMPIVPNTPLIHTSFTYSKWNMGESFG